MKQETTFYTFSDAVAAQKDKRAFKLVYGVQTLTSTMSFFNNLCCDTKQNLSIKSYRVSTEEENITFIMRFLNSLDTILVH